MKERKKERKKERNDTTMTSQIFKNALTLKKVLEAFSTNSNFGPLPIFNWGMFTWPHQDDQMNMTEISELDQKIHTDKR